MFAHLRTLIAALTAFALSPATLRAQVPGELRGRVTASGAGSRAIGDARIEIADLADATRTRSDGSFVLRGLEPRSYTVRVRAIGYRSRELDVEITNGRTTVLDVELDAAATPLDPVVVRDVRDSRATGAMTFDRQAIEASGRRDVGELVQGVPGVVVTQAGGPGAASHASIRGSSASEVLVLLDGAPLNSAVTGDADLSRVSLESVERVVVRTGAQSARYGGRALAGVIDIQTRRTRRELAMALHGGAWGELNTSTTVGGTVPARDATLGASLTADYRTLRGDFEYDVPAVRGGGTARRINSGVTSRQMLGTISVDAFGAGVTLRASAQRLGRGLAGSIVQPSATGREKQARADAGLDATWTRGALSMTSSAGVTRERVAFRDSTPPFGTAFDDTVTATAVTSTTSAVVGDDRASAAVGVEARGTDLRTSLLAPGAPHWQGLFAAFTSLHARRFVGASTRAAVDVGARVDNSSLDAATAVSPRAGASVARGRVALSASIGSGYAPPSLADQFFREGVLVRPNPTLRPERTRRDVEARLAIDEVDARLVRISADVAAFRADVDGMILWLPDFRFIWSPSNFAVRRSGWEVSGRAALAGLPVDVQGALNRAAVVYAGSVLAGQVAYRPRTTARVSVGGGRPSARFEIVSHYVGERRTVPGSALNVLDPYWRTDVRFVGARRLRGYALEATAGVDNLLDRPSAMLVDYPFPGRAWTVGLRVRRS